MNTLLFTFTAKGDIDPCFGAVGGITMTEADMLTLHHKELSSMVDVFSPTSPARLKSFMLTDNDKITSGSVVYCSKTFRRGEAYNVTQGAVLCQVSWYNGTRTTEIIKQLLIEAAPAPLTEDEILAVMDYVGERLATLHDAQLEDIEEESDYIQATTRAKESGLNEAQAKLVQKFFVRMVMKATGRG